MIFSTASSTTKSGTRNHSRGTTGRLEIESEPLDLADHTRDRIQRLVQVYARIFETIRLMDVIAVVAVNGDALGAGFELGLGCNLVVASEDATFALPEQRGRALQ